MKKRNQKAQPNKSLNFYQSVIIFFLGLFYYYGLICIIMIAFITIIVVLTGNAKPVLETINTSSVDTIPIFIGAIVCYPINWLQKYLIKYWKQA